MKIFQRKPNEALSHETGIVISSRATVEGELNTNEDVHLDGEFTGNLVTTGLVEIEANGKVAGSVKSRSLLVAGKLIDTEAECRDAIELLPSAIARANLLSRTIEIQKGAYFVGKITTKQDHDLLHT